jgi:transposase
MYYSGIDQHKRDSFITTYDSNGTVVKQARVRNGTVLIRSYFSQFPGPHKAVVESTGSWYWLADLLRKHNIELTLAHAARLKAISAAKVKTDKVV